MSETEVNGFQDGKKKKRRKIGRPKLRPGERMTVRREVGLRPREAKLLDTLAKDAGKSFNEWAREILLTVASIS